MPKPIVIYHGSCADGFAAAWVFWSKYGDTYDYHKGIYNEAPPDVTDRDVYLVDFSYTRPVVIEMLKVAKSIRLIDHHKTSLDNLAKLAGLYYFTDLHRSGCMLAWDYLYPDKEAPRLLKHVQDRDLWHFKLEDTRAIQAAVFSFEYTFENYDALMKLDDAGLHELAVQGDAIERKHFKDIYELLDVTKRSMTIGGFVVPVANMPYTLSSDAGHIMAKGEPFSATYFDTDEHRVFGLRSSPEGMDVALIAEGYGGGGHKASAGFKVPRDHELAKL